MDKITFCIPSKSNLRYLKTCIPSIRKNAFRDDHDIVVFVDQDEDGTLEWLNRVSEEHNVKVLVNPNLGESLYGIGKAYDKCIEEATTEVVMVFHADMMLGKYADKKAFDLLGPKTAVCSTRVEPPLHPNNGEKIIRDFGMWPEEFESEAFDQFVETQLEETKWSEGIFAPWMVYKDEFLSLGGHDPILRSCREDSDVFNRMMLAGFTFKQPWNSLVYHLTGRGAGSFSGDKERHRAWQQEMNNSTREFIRKWGHFVKHDQFMKPIVPPKYDTGLIIKNCNANLLSTLEPWCNTVYIDESADRAMVDNYLTLEQPNTSIDLYSKIKPYDNEKNNEILVEIDGRTFTQKDFDLLMKLPEIIKDSGEVGRFSLENLIIEIIQMNEYQHDLIVCN